jgi:hypothetical protein
MPNQTPVEVANDHMSRESASLISGVEAMKNLVRKPDGPLFHCMISYRVSTDSALARSLHDGIHMKCLNVKQQGKFPDFFVASKYPSLFDRADQAKQSSLNIFLDQFCLRAGEDWAESGFLLALSQSLVFIPILSWDVNPTNDQFIGSVGGMSAHCRDSPVDNVLLELVIAKELHNVYRALSKVRNSDECLLFPCMIILPIFTSDFFAKLNKLKDEVPLATLQRAKEALLKFGVTPGPKFLLQTLPEILAFYSSLQCLRYFEWGASVSANQRTVKRIWQILKNLARDFDFDGFQMNQFKYNQPHGSELVVFLNKIDAGYLSRFFVKYGIHSVAKLALLVGEENAVGPIAREAALCCQRPVVEEILNINSAARLARSHRLALPLRVQLRDFVDKEASVLTAIYSSSGMDIMLSKTVFLVLMLFIGCLAIAIGINAYFQSGWEGNASVLFWTGSCMFTGSAVSYFKSPRIGRYVYCALFGGDTLIFLAIFVTISIRNGGLISDSDRLYIITGNEALANFAKFYQNFSLFLIYSSMFYVMTFRQKVFWRCFCITLSHLGFYLLFFNFFFFKPPGTINFVINGFVAVGCAALLAISEIAARNGRERARKLVMADRRGREDLWNVEAASPVYTQITSFLNSSSWFHVVEQISLKNNDLVPIIVEEEEGDIDTLFRNGVLLNFFFQDWVKSWFSSDVHLEASNPKSDCKQIFDIKIPHVKIQVLRGPIKQPSRAIAKVSIPATNSLLICLMTELGSV